MDKLLYILLALFMTLLIIGVFDKKKKEKK